MFRAGLREGCDGRTHGSRDGLWTRIRSREREAFGDRETICFDLGEGVARDRIEVRAGDEKLQRDRGVGGKAAQDRAQNSGDGPCSR